MFTGIVEELGTVISLKRGSKAAVLTIKANVIFEDLKLGDSVAVNGVCLTATHISGNTFQADVMNETFNRSSLGSLKKGSVVNLERAMAANGRFGGHMVAGHVDDTGELVSVKQDDNAVWFTIKAPENIMKYCIEKGVPVTPGTANPSDVEQAIELGLEVVKFFPAEQFGGVSTIKALAAPYVGVKFMPTGGVNAKNLDNYLSCDKIVACGGSWMVKGDLVKAGDFGNIRELSAETRKLVDTIRK